MIRIEYTVDGNIWNHISKDFDDEDDAMEYIRFHELLDFATVQLLFVSNIIPIEVKKE